MVFKINEKINNKLEMLTEGLELYIDFDAPDVKRGRGDFRYSIYAHNKVDNQSLNRNQRILIQPIDLSGGQKFDFDDLKNFFLSQNEYLLPYLVDTKFDWI